MQTVVTEVCVATDWSVGHVYQVDERDRELLKTSNIWFFDDQVMFGEMLRATEKSDIRAGEGLPGKVLQTREPAWLDASIEDPSYPRGQVIREVGLLSGFATPVLAGAHVAAVMEFFSSKVREPDEDLLEVMRAVGTELGRVVERTLSEEQRFQTVVDNMPAMVHVRDSEGRFILINKEYENFYLLPHIAVQGKTLHDIDQMTEIDMQVEQNMAHDREVMASNQAIEQEQTIRRGGREHTLAMVKFPIADLKSEIVAVGGIELDVSDRKQHEAELAELVRTVEMARDQAMQATQAKSRFLANMSHELRTPLNAIIGFTRIVRRRAADQLAPRDSENLDKILFSSENLLTLINNILDLSRIEAGREEVNAGEVNIESLVDECLGTVEPLIRSDKVSLQKDLDEDLKVMITDEEKLRQIVINMLSNAVKFTTQGSVTLSTRASDGRVEISVADSGIGIPKSALKQVFEEFHQEGSVAAKLGTGLGLTISRQLAHLLGGDITVQSTEGVGSTFTLSLPVRYES